MAEHVIDLTNYKSKMSDYVSPGRYTVVVEDAESDKSKANNPMVNLWFRVQGGENDGATIVDRLVLTENSLFRVVGFLQALGFPTPKKRIKINTAKFVGRILAIDVEDGDPYKGRIKPEVRGYVRVTKKSDDDEVEDLDEESLTGTDEEDVEDIEDVEAAEPEDDEETEDEPAPKKKAKSKKSEEDADEPETVDLDDIDLG